MRTKQQIAATVTSAARIAQKNKRPVPKNLEPHCFKPGQSGNPSGRPAKPKPLTLTEAHHRELTQVDSESGRTFAELIAKRVVSCAAAGNVAAIMQALSLDSESLIREAINAIAEKENCSKAQVRAVLSLFVPAGVLI